MKKGIVKRVSVLLLLAMLCVSVGWPAALAGADDDIEGIVAGMSTRDKLAQMMFFSPRTWKADPESEAAAEKVQVLNETLGRYLAERRFGGILLFGENCGDAEQTLCLVADMQTANQAGGGLPMLIAVDQEGGMVARLGFGTSGPGSMALAATGSPENARCMARVYGEELACLGINVDFAPDTDVNDNPANPVIGVRAFGDDARVVGEYAAAYVQGLHDRGIIATLKHFPGHGNTDTDSHTGLPSVDRSHEELLMNELIPFKAAIDAGTAPLESDSSGQVPSQADDPASGCADMVMTAHIQFPRVETQTYTSVTTGEEVYIPATMSKVILTDILRGELGFEGVIVSDALEMSAIWDNYAPDDVLSMTINAGVNMLILPCVWDAGGLEQIDGMLDRAVALTEEGVIDIARVEDSVRRVLALKRKYGLLDRTDFTVTDEAVSAALEGCGGAEHRQAAWDIASRGLTLLRNENGAFPLNAQADEETLILFTAESRVGAGDFAAKLLDERGVLPENMRIRSLAITPDTEAECFEAAENADHVILVSRAWAADCLDPATENGWPVGVVNRIIDALHDGGKTAVVVSAQLPYDAACYPEADALLLTYGSSAMRAVPADSGASSAYVPNLPAALCACFGAIEPQGVLPVDLPALDDAFHITDEILYPSEIGAAGEEKHMTETGMARVAALPAYDWQKRAIFPDWKGYTDDTLAMNSMLSFKGWHGQGTLWIRASQAVESFTLYVNARKLEIPAIGGGTWRVDISDAVVDGVNTLQVSNILPMGLDGAVEVCVPYPVVLEADAGLEGIRPEALRLVSDIIQSDVDHGFPSAQLAVVKNGRLVVNQAWGTVNAYNPDGTRATESPAATPDTLYDLASVTKMFSVNYAVQKLVTDGRLDIDAPLVDLLGEDFAEKTLDFAYAGVEDVPDIATQRAWKRALTVRDVLRHQAGFPAGPRYCNPDYDMALQALGEPGANLCYAVSRAQTLEAVCRTPLLYEPGTRTLYSDVDYIVLCFAIESVTGQRLDAYMEEHFYGPLGLDHVAFLPLENGFTADDCAATELNGNTRDGHVSFDGIRTQTLRGEVHDELAWYCMEGVSGHAGLFSNASDLARLASVMLTGGYGEHRFFTRNVIDLFTAPKASDFGQWGLGWWREGDDQRVWYFGTQSASDTVGHQGWTGTLVMIDPSRDLVIAYLTNRINTPITDEANLNGFDGGRYTASTVGFVPQLLSIGMDGDAEVSAQLLDLTADMAVESLKLIPEAAGADHPNVKNALSKIGVLRSWADAAGNAEYADFADTLEALLPSRE